MRRTFFISLFFILVSIVSNGQAESDKNQRTVSSKADTLILLSTISNDQVLERTYQHLESIKVDTLYNEGTFSIFKMILNKHQLSLENDNLDDSIIFKIFYNEDGMIMNKGKDYEPENNEITFFYAKNTQTMFFMFGNTLRDIYLKKEFSHLIKIVEILEHRVFDSKTFLGTKAYFTLKEYY